jgi:large subunit ribosomal protein L24
MGGLRIKKGDRVKVLSGKYRGHEGKILKAFPGENRVIVEGVNMVKRHTRPSQQNPQGGIISKEAPIDASNVGIICGSCGRTVRVAYNVEEPGVKKRICRKCGAELG